MTFNQEDALYDFLENATGQFTLDAITAYVKAVDNKRVSRLSIEIAGYLDTQKLAFPRGPKKWISRRGCFEDARFVIKPSRMELLNGILIPGHRCVPFANPVLLPQEYVFYWKKKPIPVSDTEGAPEEFYPYYTVLGEEYAAQYVARDNPENESAFTDDFDDPAEVSIRTLDMRNIYRETGFVPGDRFVAKIIDWKNGGFELEKVAKDTWSEADLAQWQLAAEEGFEASFRNLGPGLSTEEQIAHAYFYGGRRIRDVPAYSLEEFLFEKTDRIEVVPYGIETRFWFVGKEIPDAAELVDMLRIPDKTLVESVLTAKKVPISEYMIQAYVRDALFRNEADISELLLRIVPPVIAQTLKDTDWDIFIEYVAEIFEEFREEYSLFKDVSLGPVRQRAAELHTAVIEFVAGLRSDGINAAYLPRHTFIILSQIQNHTAALLDELDTDEKLPESELDAMENALDGMNDTFEEVTELIGDALDNFRKSNISIVKNDAGSALRKGRVIQISIGGTDVWRRIVVPETRTLADIHRIIQKAFGWKDGKPYRFMLNTLSFDETDKGFDPDVKIGALIHQGVIELVYEYGIWTVKIIILATDESKKPCIAGERSPPPESINGPLRFKRLLDFLASGNLNERRLAAQELGEGFAPDFFDIEECNRILGENND
jgi:hypothetical protein